jgi:hypothetical protein
MLKELLAKFDELPLWVEPNYLKSLNLETATDMLEGWLYRHGRIALTQSLDKAEIYEFIYGPVNIQGDFDFYRSHLESCFCMEAEDGDDEDTVPEINYDDDDEVDTAIQLDEIIHPL